MTVKLTSQYGREIAVKVIVELSMATSFPAHGLLGRPLLHDAG
jgi:hypothetical protein